MKKSAKRTAFTFAMTLMLILSGCVSPITETPTATPVAEATVLPTATPEMTVAPTATPEPKIYPKPEKLPESTPIPEIKLNEGASLYVSTDGNDAASGTYEEPIATIGEALTRAKKMRESDIDGDLVVFFFGGEYFTDGFSINSALSGTKLSRTVFKAVDGEEVIFTGTKAVDSSLFVKVSGEEAERLYPEARENVYVCDLEKAGFTRNEIGCLYATGNNNASKYDGNYTGLNADVFCDDERLVWARYPDAGLLKIKSVVSLGESTSSKRNPKGPTVRLDDTTNERTKSWQIRNDIWIKGYLGRDFSSDVTPVTAINNETSELEMTFVARHGVSSGAFYFFYNVFEELTAENECYIDRENMLLYVYSEKEMNGRKVRISMTEKPILTSSSTEYIIFDGIAFEGSRVNDIELNECSDWRFENCKIRNNGGWGLYCSGENNIVSNCEICHTGKGGVSLTGGNAATLTPGNNTVINCYIHDWAQVVPTSEAGAEISGCGNRIAHNEITRSTHFAIWYDGPDEVIEYNHLHEVDLETGDSGAIYSGRNWVSYGCVIRYNIIENVGNTEHFPSAIYWDDTLAGQTAYGNIIINSGKGFLVGGGKDNSIFNNIFINNREYSILFDQRGTDWGDSWLDPNNPGSLWAGLKKARSNFNWFIRFPWLSDLHDDQKRKNDEFYCLNTARSAITDNVFIYSGNSVTKGLPGCYIEPMVFQFGAVRDNFFCEDASECLQDGTYELIGSVLESVPDFERIPVEKIGINKG